jgi:RNA polymerase sigma factor (sigma-70 family)
MVDQDVEFEGWYRAEHPRLVSWLTVAVADVELARDAAAEAFARAFAQWRRVSRMESPAGWTHTVALNVARRQLRRRAPETRLLRRDVEPRPAPELVAIEVWDAVRVLPLRQRTAIALRYVLDLSQSEIAQVLGVAPGTVSATLSTARRHLAISLGPNHARSDLANE